MNNKVFLQQSILIPIILSLFVGIDYMGGWALIHSFDTVGWPNFEMLFLGLFAIAFGTYEIIKFCKHAIFFRQDEIYAPKTFGWRPILQLKVQIRYDEIKDIYLGVTTVCADGKAANPMMPPLFYLAFVCLGKNGKNKEKRIFVQYYRKKQIEAMIDEAILRAKAVGNDLAIGNGKEIVQKFLDYGKKPSKRKKKSKVAKNETKEEVKEISFNNSQNND